VSTIGVLQPSNQFVSGSDYHTANLFLLEVWRMKNVLATKCEDENEYIKSMARKMNTEF
jgi:hypothetical protein